MPIFSDVPTLHGLDANCTLHLDQNFFDIRASAWNLTLDLMANDTSCGTKYTVHGIKSMIININLTSLTCPKALSRLLYRIMKTIEGIFKVV